MNPSIVLGFQVHHPLRFVEEESHEDDARAFEYMVHNAYVPFIELLLEITRDNPSFRGFCSLSGEHLRHISEQGDKGQELLGYWERLIATGRMQTITEPFMPSIGIWKSERNLFDQVLKHHLHLRKLFQSHNRTLRLFKHYHWEKTANIAGLLGFENILLEGKYTEFGFVPKAPLKTEDQLILQEHAPLDSRHHLHIDHERPKALVMNKSLSQAFWDKFNEGDLGQTAAQDFLHRLSSSHFESFILNIEEFGTHPRRNEAFVFLYEIIKTLIQEGVTFYQPEEWLQIAPHQELNLACLKEPPYQQHPQAPTDNHILQTAYTELVKTLDMLESTSSSPLAWHYLAHDTHQANLYFSEHLMLKEEDDQYNHFEYFLHDMRFIQTKLDKMN